MSFLNPISPIQVGGQSSVSRVSTFGTTFSNTIVGGFMQVNSLTDLIYTIPSGSNGLIEYSGNTIPIQFSVLALLLVQPTIILLYTMPTASIQFMSQDFSLVRFITSIFTSMIMPTPARNT